MLNLSPCYMLRICRKRRNNQGERTHYLPRLAAGSFSRKSFNKIALLPYPFTQRSIRKVAEASILVRRRETLFELEHGALQRSNLRSNQGNFAFTEASSRGHGLRLIHTVQDIYLQDLYGSPFLLFPRGLLKRNVSGLYKISIAYACHILCF